MTSVNDIKKKLKGVSCMLCIRQDKIRFGIFLIPVYTYLSVLVIRTPYMSVHV